jgi:hypothetical protein
VLYYSIGYAPSYKVELGDSRAKSLKVYALGPAKRIKQLLRISIQTRLVGYMDREHLAVGSRVRHMLVLGVVGHEPLETP